jgi:hypothetical protein
MSQPVYKLKDDMAVCAKHMRAERVRNDDTYQTKTGTVRVSRLTPNQTVGNITWNDTGYNTVITNYGILQYTDVKSDYVPAW